MSYFLLPSSPCRILVMGSLSFIYLFVCGLFIFKCMSVLHACMSVHSLCMCLDPLGQRRALDLESLVLEL